MNNTDNGHEFQWQFHCHVERSHATDDQEFYQILEYKGDVDLHKRVKERADFYNNSVLIPL